MRIVTTFDGGRLHCGEPESFHKTIIVRKCCNSNILHNFVVISQDIIYIRESVFRLALPEIWTIFKVRGSVVGTPPVSMIMLAGGLLLPRTPYRAGVEYDCFFLTCVQSRTPGRSYGNGFTPLSYYKPYKCLGAAAEFKLLL